ncbi:unnamed protein product [Lepidochelys kempii]
MGGELKEAVEAKGDGVCVCREAVGARGDGGTGGGPREAVEARGDGGMGGELREAAGSRGDGGMGAGPREAVEARGDGGLQGSSGSPGWMGRWVGGPGKQWGPGVSKYKLNQGSISLRLALANKRSIVTYSATGAFSSYPNSARGGVSLLPPAKCPGPRPPQEQTLTLMLKQTGWSLRCHESSGSFCGHRRAGCCSAPQTDRISCGAACARAAAGNWCGRPAGGRYPASWQTGGSVPGSAPGDLPRGDAVTGAGNPPSSATVHPPAPQGDPGPGARQPGRLSRGAGSRLEPRGLVGSERREIRSCARLGAASPAAAAGTRAWARPGLWRQRRLRGRGQCHLKVRTGVLMAPL